MKLKVLASGSSGNAYLLTSSGRSILLECGIRFEEIKKKLNFNFDNILGCLLTHEHMDHAKSVTNVLAHGIDCYMSQGTADALQLNHHRLHIANEQFTLDNFTIMPFKVEHDVKEPLGFLIYDNITKEKLVFATDTPYLIYRFNNVNYYMIECNYDRDKLEENIETGVINHSMRNRLLNSHFEINSLIEYFRFTDLKSCRKIVLIHLSSNNSSDDFQARIQNATGIDTEIAWNQNIELRLYPF
ncbi:MBL fold metallo-hydrolase [Alkalibaculum sp. M08DMB]|uniref:MBL fold metallo-hydrolase n=1 Tax=Alkalibaculum sporogenes TaxID=2655001 RepID=A0A6A7K9U3_9FIRM|nr:MBL fold metallo-hydrolase [Alkalibaculum sporogenes]